MTLPVRALKLLEPVHIDLTRVVVHAADLSGVTFTVIEGRRTLARQQQLLASGATTTLRSRHLTGHAVDLAALVNGRIRWDWPLYHKIAAVMKAAADELRVPIEWGGDWVTFKDGPHFQLPWREYPADKEKIA
jgi:peptidoglycan L-alanyl-D-glutamate endopeptidase CwlK